MREAGPIQEYLTAAHPLITLLRELLEHDSSQEISMQNSELKLVLKRGNNSGATK
jgi:hypothetical protein